MWQGIERRLGGGPDRENVVQLRRRADRWRGIATAMTALAASLALFIALGRCHLRLRPYRLRLNGPCQFAHVRDARKRRKQDQGRCELGSRSPAFDSRRNGPMPSDPRHAHELWVIPPGGKPRSLGTMGTSKQMHMRLADALAQLLQQGATIAISVEPPGGSPTGAPTGPVVVAGSLKQA